MSTWITVRAPVNIAVIKYWGKKDEQLIIPLNDSISGTLTELYSTTTVVLTDRIDEDRFYLNGEKTSIADNKRLKNLLDNVRAIAKPPESIKFAIASTNNFPTAAGLASSASGNMALAYAFAQLFKFDDNKLMQITRMGSGSAIRSVYGGFVQWVSGNSSETSIARQIVDEHHWPEMRVLILVVNNKAKEIGSSKGMLQTVQTSSLVHHRATVVVPERIQTITETLKKRDFHTFAEITMRDSNHMHACCQDTWPTIRYMNDISWEVIRLVQAYNDYRKTNKIAYTFDAGPNPCLYLTEETLAIFFSLLDTYFPSTTDASAYYRGKPRPAPVELPVELADHLSANGCTVQSNVFKCVINAEVGPGPQVVPNQRLIDDDGVLLK